MHSGNVVIDYDIHNKFHSCHITDLGLSRPVNAEESKNTIYGIMPYIAPEVLRGQPYTQKADVYSLGMIMYELFTGWSPFYNENHNVKLALKDLWRRKAPVS